MTAEPISTDFVALVCVWEEAELLPGLLHSLGPPGRNVDRIVVADGRFAHYPGDSFPSTDGTQGIALEHGCELIEAPEEGWDTEHEKRNALLAACQPGDEVLIIDADERAIFGERFCKRQLFGDFKVEVRGVEGTDGLSYPVRLFMYRPSLRYHSHFHIYTGDGQDILFGTYAKMPEATFRIEHLHHLRSPERHESDQEWEEYLVPYEQALGAYGRPPSQRVDPQSA
jgi:hypothetical protein